MSLVVLVPVLARPHRIRPTIQSIRETTPGADIVFVANPDDRVELDVLRRCGADVLIHAGGYAAKINAAVRATRHRHIFFGADDLRWTPGWYEAALTHLARGAQVVGVNDLCAERTIAGRHATHFLLTREYAASRTIDGSPGPLFEGYDHSCVDDELVGVARRRGVLVIDPRIVVEHLHPDAGKAPRDETYLAGRRNIRADRRLFRARRYLWT